MPDTKEEIEQRVDELAREYGQKRRRAAWIAARRLPGNYLRCVRVLIGC
jgi:hypothetical protein